MKTKTNCPARRRAHKRIAPLPGRVLTAAASAVLFASLLLSRAAASAFSSPETSPQSEVGALGSGASVERQIAGGDLHSYEVNLSSGPYRPASFSLPTQSPRR